jgi:two-component system NarL family sensor kinase
MTDQNVVHILIASIILITVFGIFLICFIVYIRSVQKAFHKEKQQLLLENGMVEEGVRIQNEVAKEVHDNILQTALLVKIHLHQMETQSKDEKQQKLIKDTLSLVQQQVDDCNKILTCLNVDYIKSSYLSDILKIEMGRIFKHNGTLFKLEVKGTEKSLKPEFKTTIYRIVIEAILNVRKHAGASTILVLLEFQKISLTIIVKDDGYGFSSDKLYAKGTTGLAYMYQRASLLEAELKIDSRPGAGCTITLSCPY